MSYPTKYSGESVAGAATIAPLAKMLEVIISTIEQIEIRTNGLNNRLRPVLSNIPEVAKEKGQYPQDSEYMNRLNEIRERLVTIEDNLQYLLDGLQV